MDGGQIDPYYRGQGDLRLDLIHQGLEVLDGVHVAVGRGVVHHLHRLDHHLVPQKDGVPVFHADVPPNLCLPPALTVKIERREGHPLGGGIALIGGLLPGDGGGVVLGLGHLDLDSLDLLAEDLPGVGAGVHMGHKELGGPVIIPVFDGLHGVFRLRGAVVAEGGR